MKNIKALRDSVRFLRTRIEVDLKLSVDRHNPEWRGGNFGSYRFEKQTHICREGIDEHFEIDPNDRSLTIVISKYAPSRQHQQENAYPAVLSISNYVAAGNQRMRFFSPATLPDLMRPRRRVYAVVALVTIAPRSGPDAVAYIWLPGAKALDFIGHVWVWVELDR